MLIEDKALDILNKYWDGCLPVDIKAISSSIGINIIENYELTDIISQIEKKDNQIQIMINGNELKIRQRFALAHELGHFVLGHLNNGIYKILKDTPDSFKTKTNYLENEANQFAMAVLIPKNVLCEVLQDKKYSSLQQLAEIFAVSQSAMYCRVQNLNLFEG